MSRRIDERGFALPVIILLMSLMAITAYTVLLQSSNSLTLTYRQTYSQMARVASKAAIDYAQEQFDKSTCGNYTGTAETTLVANTKYRLTFKADVLSTSADGLTKLIQGTGSVYLPKNSASARYIFNIESEVVNTFASCKTPLDFNPLLWLDGSDTATMLGQITGTAHTTTTFGAATNATRDTLQELASSGAQTTNSWQNKDMQMSTCATADYDNSTCTANATKYTYNGIVFQNVSIPKNALITSATLTLVGDTPSGAGGSITNKITGLYQSASNPYTPLWTSTGTGQIKTPLTTNGLHTSQTTSFSTNNLPPGNGVSVNVAGIIQEMVNNANWGQNINDGKNDQYNMGFAIERSSGSGSRNLKKDGLILDVTYVSLSNPPSTNGSGIVQWNDKSGNGNNAIATYGNTPTRQDNQINGNSVVRFNSGAYLSPLALSLTGKREMTTFAVIKPNFGTSANDGRIVSATSTTVNSDLISGNSIVPLLRNGNSSGFSSIYSGSGASYRSNYTCSPTCASTPSLFSSVFRIQNSSKVDSLLRYNGGQVVENDGYAPTGSPYLFSVNQIYIGGTRSGSGVGSGTGYLNGDYAEIIVYDHALTCYESESIENYLRNKWGLSASAYPETCIDGAVPTL